MATVKSDFRENLRSLRKDLDLSQRELSQRCNYDVTYIGKIERGDSLPSLETMNRLAEALETSIVDLMVDPRRDVLPSRILESYEGLSENLSDFYFDRVGNPLRQILFLDEENRLMEATNTFYEWIDEPPEELEGLHFLDLPLVDRTNVSRDRLEGLLEQTRNGGRVLERLVATKENSEKEEHLAMSMTGMREDMDLQGELVVELLHLVD